MKSMQTVLIVEDSLTDLEILWGYLSKENFEIITAKNGKEALEKIERQLPDLIVLDIILPGPNGYELCRRLKNDPATRQVPIVMCSSKGENVDFYWGLKQGADAYLTKPVTKAEFTYTVKQLIKASCNQVVKDDG
ncbi:response regulator with CheY-like receiver domain and winged-helix DNA-binding domain [Pleurocapsa sp. PCC 7327]|nr:response regulator with CheY-like receiver domain and winged-helix DNA-binding domain [Pleurocapsa sp. PCC 7327]